MAGSNKKELGITGRSYSSRLQYNLGTDEYLSTLKWPSDIAIYNKMERSDSQVKATLLMLELPIRSTSWYIKPFDNSRKAKKISDFIEEALFSSMTLSFDDFIKEACTMFTYGHAVFEKVFKLNSKKELIWSKFATRPQSTIYDIMYDNVGDLKGVQQTLINRGWQNIHIPIEKLLVFSHDMKQGDYRGRSALRSAYKHWSIKDFIYKLLNIGVERNLVGTPVVKLPENFDDGDYERAKAIVTNLRSNEYGGATLPPGFELDMFEGKRTLVDVMPYIEYQDTLISRSILAQFMNLGSNSAGSFALSKDQTDLFLMMLGAIAKNISGIINSHAIKQLVNYNFASDLYPELCFRPLGNFKIFETLKLLVDGKLIIPDESLEDYIRDMLELPEKEENDETYVMPDYKTEVLPEDKSVEDMANNVSGTSEPSKSKNDISFSRQAETKKLAEPKNHIDVVDWQSVDTNFNNIEDEFRTEGRKIIQKQLNDLSKRIKKIKLEDISTIQVGYKSQMTTFVANMYKKAFNAGVSQVQKELKTRLAPELDEKMLMAKAAVVANNISERVKVLFLSEYLNQQGLTENTELQSKRAMKLILGG
jgi:phage gp29-like protein